MNCKENSVETISDSNEHSCFHNIRNEYEKQVNIIKCMMKEESSKIENATKSIKSSFSILRIDLEKIYILITKIKMELNPKTILGKIIKDNSPTHQSINTHGIHCNQLEELILKVKENTIEREAEIEELINNKFEQKKSFGHLFKLLQSALTTLKWSMTNKSSNEIEEIGQRTTNYYSNLSDYNNYNIKIHSNENINEKNNPDCSDITKASEKLIDQLKNYKKIINSHTKSEDQIAEDRWKKNNINRSVTPQRWNPKNIGFNLDYSNNHHYSGLSLYGENQENYENFELLKTKIQNLHQENDRFKESQKILELENNALRNKLIENENKIQEEREEVNEIEKEREMRKGSNKKGIKTRILKAHLHTKQDQVFKIILNKLIDYIKNQIPFCHFDSMQLDNLNLQISTNESFTHSDFYQLIRKYLEEALSSKKKNKNSPNVVIKHIKLSPYNSIPFKSEEKYRAVSTTSNKKKRLFSRENHTPNISNYFSQNIPFNEELKYFQKSNNPKNNKKKVHSQIRTDHKMRMNSNSSIKPFEEYRYKNFINNLIPSNELSSKPLEKVKEDLMKLRNMQEKYYKKIKEYKIREKEMCTDNEFLKEEIKKLRGLLMIQDQNTQAKKAIENVLKLYYNQLYQCEKNSYQKIDILQRKVTEMEFALNEKSQTKRNPQFNELKEKLVSLEEKYNILFKEKSKYLTNLRKFKTKEEEYLLKIEELSEAQKNLNEKNEHIYNSHLDVSNMSNTYFQKSTGIFSKLGLETCSSIDLPLKIREPKGLNISKGKNGFKTLCKINKSTNLKNQFFKSHFLVIQNVNFTEITNKNVNMLYNFNFSKLKCELESQLEQNKKNEKQNKTLLDKCSKLQLTISEDKSILNNKEIEINLLKDEKMKNEIEINRLKDEILKMPKMKKIEKENNQTIINAQNIELKKHKEVLEAKLKENEIRINCLKDEIKLINEENKKNYQNLMDQFKLAKSSIDSKNKEIESITSYNSKINSEQDEILSYFETKNSNPELHFKIEENRFVKKSLKLYEFINQIFKSKDHLQTEIIELKNINVSLKSEEKKIFNKKFNELQNKNVQVLNNIVGFANTLKIKWDNCEEIINKCFTSFVEKFSLHTNSIKKLNSHISHLKVHNGYITNKYRDEKRTNSKIINEHKIYETKIHKTESHLQAIISEIQKEKNELENKIKEQKDQNNKLLQNNNCLKKDIDVYAEKANKLNLKILEKEEIIINLENNNEKSIKRMQELEEKIISESEDNSLQKKANQEIISDLSNKIEELEKDKDKEILEQKIDRIQKDKYTINNSSYNNKLKLQKIFNINILNEEIILKRKAAENIQEYQKMDKKILTEQSNHMKNLEAIILLKEKEFKEQKEINEKLMKERSLKTNSEILQMEKNINYMQLSLSQGEKSNKLNVSTIEKLMDEKNVLELKLKEFSEELNKARIELNEVNEAMSKREENINDLLKLISEDEKQHESEKEALLHKILELEEKLMEFNPEFRRSIENNIIIEEAELEEIKDSEEIDVIHSPQIEYTNDSKDSRDEKYFNDSNNQIAKNEENDNIQDLRDSQNEM